MTYSSYLNYFIFQEGLHAGSTKNLAVCPVGRRHRAGSSTGAGAQDISAHRRAAHPDRRQAGGADQEGRCAGGEEDRLATAGRCGHLPESGAVHPALPRRVLDRQLRAGNDRRARCRPGARRRAGGGQRVLEQENRERGSRVRVAHRWQRPAVRADDPGLLRRHQADAARCLAARHQRAAQRGAVPRAAVKAACGRECARPHRLHPDGAAGPDESVVPLFRRNGRVRGDCVRAEALQHRSETDSDPRPLDGRAGVAPWPAASILLCGAGSQRGLRRHARVRGRAAAEGRPARVSGDDAALLRLAGLRDERVRHRHGGLRRRRRRAVESVAEGSARRWRRKGSASRRKRRIGGPRRICRRCCS